MAVMLLPLRDVVKNRRFTVREVARTTSTQDLVRRAARAGASDGYVCLAREQTEGRGRQGRRWLAPLDSALLVSVLLRVPREQTPALPFVAGLAVLDALATFGTNESRLKWPNDVLARGRKLAGLLVELEPSSDAGEASAIVGLGLNLRRTSLPGIEAISLDDLVAPPPPARRLLDAWLHALAARLADLGLHGTAPLFAAWRRNSVGLGGRVRAVVHDGEPIEGVAEDVEADGSLRIRTDAGVVRMVAGDVHLLPDDAA